MYPALDKQDARRGEHVKKKKNRLMRGERRRRATEGNARTGMVAGSKKKKED